MLTLKTPDKSSAATIHATNGDMPHLKPLPAEAAKELVQLFKLLADESRLRIVYYLLQQEELNVRTLCRLLSQSQPAVSHHLALMREAGVIECRRDGKHNFYRLVAKRCRDYLDIMFAARGHEIRKVRIEDALLSYGRDGKPASSA